MHCNQYSSKPCLIAQALEPIIVSLKPDLQALACSSENHDNDHSLRTIQEARSDNYAPGTQSSEEYIHLT